MEQDSIFLSYVRYIFKKWVGFREALLQGMGGVYAKEKEQWMGNEIENYFKSYSARVRPEDIEEYLGTMLENEFDTYFEDGSLQEISVKFCEAYPLSLTNPDAEIFQEMKRNSVNVASNRNSSANNFNQENDEETACKRMEQLKVTENSDDDGWTTVGKRNRNK
ncbi:uncharacterized protein TNIN_71561 [Trichonephila inaurata madagascariensis]|uniref:Pre-rRNA-processing protein TSR2 homolog n=1 Tax=Trichonephila inaurata madagascariensis TaxID=2747483 RepID=A0A8X6IWA6_9ARAC|nr:uncharacterized protein TNIN_71561 [Trichonephila inaurata madagascariensis]